MCNELMGLVQNVPVPVLAQVRGLATAAGCQLVASCDIAVAADTARFATPGLKIYLSKKLLINYPLFLLKC